ncbi:MAG: hypothetical protein MJ072_04540 [Clostridia bacterium]|nr:hypothetical protein [Clostridia bacterium]
MGYEYDEPSVKEVLDRFPDADGFVLCATYGEREISERESEIAFNDLVEYDKNLLKRTYDAFKPDNELADFDFLYEKIKDECALFEEKYKAEYMENYGFFFNGFICDHVGRDTDFSTPLGLFWHFYQRLGSEIDSLNTLNGLKKLSTEPVTSILNSEEYSVLKKNYVGKNVTFTTHCTGGPLQVEFTFKLTDETRAWLLSRASVYDFEGELEDLALTKNGEIIFSSCTHERFCDEIK